MYKFKNQLIPKDCDNRCVFSTIINRCYYSSYLYVSEWLYETYNFKPLSKQEFKGLEFITEHKQIRLKLKEINQIEISNNLFNLFGLRKKADYNPFSDISYDELENAMHLMNHIFQNLKFKDF